MGSVHQPRNHLNRSVDVAGFHVERQQRPAGQPLHRIDRRRALPGGERAVQRGPRGADVAAAIFDPAEIGVRDAEIVRHLGSLGRGARLVRQGPGFADALQAARDQ